MTHLLLTLLPVDPVDRMIAEARATRDATARVIRDDFQRAYPQYTPPPGAQERYWIDWVNYNVKLHGLVGPGGFYDRFPEARVRELRETNPPSSQGSLWELLSDPNDRDFPRAMRAVFALGPPKPREP